MAGDGRLYRVVLDDAAVERGEDIICELLRWGGEAALLAEVRIVRSTSALYRVGTAGVLLRSRLIPLGTQPPA